MTTPRAHSIIETIPATISARAAASLAPAASHDEIHDAELMLTAFRTLLLLVLFAAPFLLRLGIEFSRREIMLMALASLYNIAMGVASLFPARYGVRRPLILAMDTLLIALWIEFTHAWELMAFYFVVVTVAAMWYRVVGGILAAAVCDFLFLLLWGRVAGDPNTFVLPVFEASLGLNVVLLFVVGALAGYLAEAQERERQQSLERELLLANYEQEIDISTHLQPLLMSRFGPNSAFDLGAAMQSARGAGGGDYLDALPLPDGRTLLCIADVSGKSVRAQARVPLLKYALRALAPLHSQPADLAARLQSTLAPELGPEIYIALCLVVLDAKNESLIWCNAGHSAPFLVRESETAALETTSPALGLFPEIAPVQRALPWRRGDALLLFTDGLADALSLGGEADGEEQVGKLAARLSNPSDTASEAAQALVDLASAALEDRPFLARHFTLGEKLISPHVHRDDVAVLVARFCPQTSI